jgi:hypothetical protein
MNFTKTLHQTKENSNLILKLFLVLLSVILTNTDQFLLQYQEFLDFCDP